VARNKYLPETLETYEPSGLAYKLPIVGDVLADVLLSDEKRLAAIDQRNAQRLTSEKVNESFNNEFLKDARNVGLLGANFEPIDDFVVAEDGTTTGASFLSRLTEPEWNGSQFVSKHGEFLQALIGDFPLFAKTKRTTQGDTVNFQVTNMFHNPNKNTYFLIGKNYKGDTAPKTLENTDSLNDEIAEFTAADMNELLKTAAALKYVDSQYAPGILQMSNEDADAQILDNVTARAMAIKEARTAGLLEDATSMSQFNERLAGLIASEQDPVRVEAENNQIQPAVLTETSPEIAALLAENKQSSEPIALTEKQQKQFESYKRQIAAGFARGGGLVTAPTEEQMLEDFKRINGITSMPDQMIDGESLSEEDQQSVLDWVNNLSTADKAALVAGGVLLIAGTVFTGGAALAGAGAALNTLRGVKIGKKVVDLAKKTYTKPKTKDVAISKKGNRYDVDSPQGKQIVRAGEQDMKKGSVGDKLQQTGDRLRGKNPNPRVDTEVVKDAAGNVERVVSPKRAIITGSGGAAVTIPAGDQIIDNVRENAAQQQPTGDAGATNTQPVEFDIPTFTSAEEAVDYFQNDENMQKFIQATSSKDAQQVANDLNDAFESIGVTDSQSFTTNLEEIIQAINPQGLPNRNELAAAIIADRSGLPEGEAAKLYYQTLNAFSRSTEAEISQSAAATERQNESRQMSVDFLTNSQLASGIATDIQSLTTLIGEKSFDEIKETGGFTSIGEQFSSKYQDFYPQFAIRGNRIVQVNRAAIERTIQGAGGLAPGELARAQANQRSINKLHKQWANAALSSFVSKQEDANKPGPVRGFINWVMGKRQFEKPDDYLFPYMDVKLDKNGDLEQIVMRDPNDRTETLTYGRDDQFVRNFGQLDAQVRLAILHYAQKPNE